MSGNKKFSLAEVARHNSKQDIYIIHNNKVHNITSLIDEHPGGEEVILELAGGDITDAFAEVGHSEEAEAQLAELQIGILDSASNSALNNNHSAKKIASGEGVDGMFWCGLVIAMAAAAFGGYRFLFISQ